MSEKTDVLKAEEVERVASLAEYDQANCEGRAAYLAGAPVTDCPYPAASGILREGWLDGYHG